MTNAVETERAPESNVQPSESGNPPEPREQTIARINTMLPKCSPAFLRGLGDEISEHQSKKAGTKSGNREQLAAIACASEAFDKVSCLHTAASKLLEDHATGSGGEPTMSERDCTTLCYLLNSADDVVENASAKLAKYNIELMDILDAEAGAEPIHPPVVNRDALLDDIRERVRRAAGLTQAAVLTEASLTNAGASNVYGDPSDYFSAVVGTIRAANSELDDLLKLLDGTPEGSGE